MKSLGYISGHSGHSGREVKESISERRAETPKDNWSDISDFDNNKDIM